MLHATKVVIVSSPPDNMVKLMEIKSFLLGLASLSNLHLPQASKSSANPPIHQYRMDPIAADWESGDTWWGHLQQSPVDVEQSWNVLLLE